MSVWAPAASVRPVSMARQSGLTEQESCQPYRVQAYETLLYISATFCHNLLVHEGMLRSAAAAIIVGMICQVNCKAS